MELHILTRLHILFLLSAYVTPLTFDFSSFGQSDTPLKLFTEGDASVGKDQFLHLTNADQSQTAGSVGRVSYRESFLLLQHTTGKLANFTTDFTFVIQPDNSGCGLVFFLAPNGSLLERELGSGGSMGLPVNITLENPVRPTNGYAFVAVEFDTLPNQEPNVYDPPVEHVGIDVKSLHSIKTQPWTKLDVDTTMLAQHNAKISYDSFSKNLSVSLKTNYYFPQNINGAPVYTAITDLYQVVDLNKYLPDRVIVGFSASTESNSLYSIMSWNFTSTSLVDLESPPPSSAQAPVSQEKAPESATTASKNQSQIPSPVPTSIATWRKQNISVLVVALIICSTVGVVFLIGGFIWFIFWIKNRPPGPADEQFGRETCPQKYTYRELEAATDNFSAGNKLGHGGFGNVYKGFDRTLKADIAVKKISEDSDQGTKEYEAEIRILSSLRHMNLVQLLGWCHEKEALLVYEYMPNGSLDSHLFKGRSLLSWEIRYKVAEGLATVLRYIQHEWKQYVVHRDIKSGNIMLDSKFNPKLGDFGLARLVDHDKSSKTTIIAGTRGYMAPEILNESRARRDNDIYSFGVVALEIACGRKRTDNRLSSDKINLLEWVWELYKEGKVIEAADPKLGVTHDRERVKRLLILGLWCSHTDRRIRPGIDQVIDVLNFKDVHPFPHIPVPEESQETSIYLTSSDEYQVEA